MTEIFSGMLELIGNTPLVALENYCATFAPQGVILAKLESCNPAGSVKDRIAKRMIEKAEEQNLLTPASVIIEPTSGNTGIGLAAVAASKGYRIILTMPETMSLERRNLLKAYGAELVLTEGSKGMNGAIARAKELGAEIPGSFIPSQFENPANPAVHEETTGPELWRDTKGKIDIFVAGVGTGGTITGVGRYLKKQNPRIQIVAVEPENSQVLAGKSPGAHGIQGIGAGFIPSVLDTTLLDIIMPVTDAEAYTAARRLRGAEGILAGISSGAALHAATVLANLPEHTGKNIVVLLPDGGERYLSTPLFDA